MIHRLYNQGTRKGKVNNSVVVLSVTIGGNTHTRSSARTGMRYADNLDETRR